MNQAYSSQLAAIASGFSAALPPEVEELACLFPDERPLYLVGGAVRDLILGKQPLDYDFTSALRPEEVKRLVSPWAESMWTVGERFGTIGAGKGGHRFEITTFRADQYTDVDRKPEISYSDDIRDDLFRRDFTINALAWCVKTGELIDEFSGIEDLARQIIRTPGSVEVSFTDDPLRMLRALRYHATLDFKMSDEVLSGIAFHGPALSKVSVERIAEEFSKTICAERPSSALRHMFSTGLCMYFLPELAELDLPQPAGYHHKNVLEHTLQVVDTVQPELIVRLAALFHDIAKPRTRQIVKGAVNFHHHEYVGGKMTQEIMRRLKYPRAVIRDVSLLVEMHLRPASYREEVWTDSAVRRYVRDAAELLDKLNDLASADCTSLNPRVSRKAWERQKELEHRIAKVREEEDLLAIRPFIDGNVIMETFGLPPGREVGQLRGALLQAQIDGKITDVEQAWTFLREMRKELEPASGTGGRNAEVVSDD